MNKEQKLGLIRELLMAVGSALATFGYLKEGFDAAPAAGAILALISLVWAVVAKQSFQVIGTLVRKALSGVGGALVAYGFSTPEQTAAISAVLLPVIAMVWSGKANVNVVMLFLIPAFLLPMTSCTGVLAGVTGQEIQTVTVRSEDPTDKPIEIAERDWNLAQMTDEGEVSYGLYDAGYVADKTVDAIDAVK